MITTFESSEEKKFLYDLLWRGIMSTDLIFNEIDGIEEYKKHLVTFRQRCFAYLEEEDPNIELLKKMVHSESKNDPGNEKVKTPNERIDDLYEWAHSLANKDNVIEQKIDRALNSIRDINIFVERLEESLINRINEQTSYIGQVRSSINATPIVNPILDIGYDKLSDHNRLMINQIISELNSSPDTCLTDYDIVGKVDNIRDIKSVY